MINLVATININIILHFPLNLKLRTFPFFFSRSRSHGGEEWVVGAGRCLERRQSDSGTPHPCVRVCQCVPAVPLPHSLAPLLVSALGIRPSLGCACFDPGGPPCCALPVLLLLLLHGWARAPPHPPSHIHGSSQPPCRRSSQWQVPDQGRHQAGLPRRGRTGAPARSATHAASALQHCTAWHDWVPAPFSPALRSASASASSHSSPSLPVPAARQPATCSPSSPYLSTARAGVERRREGTQGAAPAADPGPGDRPTDVVCALCLSLLLLRPCPRAHCSLQFVTAASPSLPLLFPELIDDGPALCRVLVVAGGSSHAGVPHWRRAPGLLSR